MKVFSREEKDGLADLIKAQTSLAYVAEVKPFTVETEVLEGIQRTLASNDNHKITVRDLHFNDSILVSSVWNLNDDIFTPEEIAAAKDTPVNKPSNANHIETKIIGHILSSTLVDKDFNAIAGDGELPDLVHLLTHNVIYRTWADEEYQQLVANIIDSIDRGEKFVSMECAFRNFDYGLLDTAGNIYLVPRNDETSFLSKSLKCYGGIGNFENYRIGRVLRDITFVGKGYVDNPANPASVIFKNPTNISINQVRDGVSILQMQNASNKSLEVKMEIEELKTQVAELQKQIAALTDSNASLKASVDELTTANSSLKEENSTKANELVALKKEQTKAKRVSLLVNAGISLDVAEAKVATYADLSDEVFNAVAEEIVAASNAKKEVPAKAAEKPAPTEVVIEKTEDKSGAEVAQTVASTTQTTTEDNGLTKAMADIGSYLNKALVKKTTSKTNKE